MTPANTLSFPDNLFFTRLQQSAHHLLLLDYDGTLSPFVEDRFKASPYPGVTELLGAILDQPRSRLVIITGRPISEIQPLLNMSPGPEIWGAHGWQRLLPDGTLEQFPLPPETDKILTLVRLKLLEQVPVEKIDVKPGSVAVHWRGLSEEKRRAFSRHARHACSPYQEHKDLALQEFDGGLELRVKGRDKGTSVTAVLAGSPADTFTAYLGDDRTDEDAFLALAGRGAGILVRKEFRKTQAQYWLKPPEELLEFLRHWRDAG